MKTYSPLLILTALLLGGCGLSQTPVVNQSGNQDNNPAPTEVAAQKSLKDLLGLGITQKCSWKTTSGDDELSGDIWVSGKKFKQVSKINTPEGQMEVVALSDGEWMYSWNTQTKGSGIKMNLSQLPSPEPGSNDRPPVDMDKKLDYQCTPATLSPDDLKVPTDIEFMDLTQGVKGIQDQFQGMDLDKLKESFPIEETE